MEDQINQPAEMGKGLTPTNHVQLKPEPIEVEIDGCIIAISWFMNKDNKLSMEFCAYGKLEDGVSLHVHCYSAPHIDQIWRNDSDMLKKIVVRFFNTIKRVCHLKCFPGIGDGLGKQGLTFEISGRWYEQALDVPSVQIHYSIKEAIDYNPTSL